MPFFTIQAAGRSVVFVLVIVVFIQAHRAARVDLEELLRDRADLRLQIPRRFLRFLRRRLLAALGVEAAEVVLPLGVDRLDSFLMLGLIVLNSFSTRCTASSCWRWVSAVISSARRLASATISSARSLAFSTRPR